MGRNVLKASIELRSLVRHGRIETHFEIPTFLSQTVSGHVKYDLNYNVKFDIL